MAEKELVTISNEGEWSDWELPLNNDECNQLCKRCPSLPFNSGVFDSWSWLTVMEKINLAAELAWPDRLADCRDHW